MQLLRRNKTLPTTSPTHGKFSHAASYYDWVKGAIWDVQDEWRDQSRVGRYKIAVVEHNRPFIDVIRERSEYDLPLISTLMDRTPGLLHWEQDTLCVEAFCENAHGILNGLDQERRQDSQASQVEEPKAWVSDRNYWLCRDGMAQDKLYGPVLSRLELYQFLKRERFRLNSAGEMIGPSRQLHVTNPDGDFWHASFVINFNLPFFAIGPSRRQDKRVFYTSNHRFRNRYPLDSLNLQDPRSRLGNGQNFSFQDKLVLHEAVYALTATGPSEPHWTVYCFEEDFFEEEDNKDDDGGEGDDDDDDDESLDVSVDPIINEPELKEPMNMWLPRQYCLAALAKQLDKILGYHSHVHEVFKHNLEVYMSSTREGSSGTTYPSAKPAWKGFPELLGKVIFCNLKLIEAVDDFLEKDVQVSLDGAPLGALWKSLRGDTKAMKSLRYIKDCLNRLRATGGKLEQIKESFEELRREVT
ncbi:arginyl-trna synthetase [Fusarium circinatum]|uniref:Arginyl-trna synthetase n=1 Tax=Fusarium circinatum TaxID=48490 RepID=A0A8H5UKA8_FUSCI|nr:arginyl-trna synthetase [Fusarium circinatum]